MEAVWESDLGLNHNGGIVQRTCPLVPGLGHLTLLGGDIAGMLAIIAVTTLYHCIFC